MSNTKITKQRLKQIIRQLTGDTSIKETLVPEVSIRGNGDIWCYCESKRALIRVARGIKGYVLDEDIGDEKVIVYLFTGYMVEIEAEELIYTGFD
jgi:hypothetical protein